MYSGEFPMSTAAYFASLVDFLLLICISIISSPAVSVLIFPLYCNFVPQLIIFILLTLSFCRRMLQ